MRGIPGPAALYALAVAAAIGCGQVPAPREPEATLPGGTATQPAALAEPQPERGGVFHIIGLRELPHLHPWTNQDANMGFYLRPIFDQLLDYDWKPFQDYREEYRLMPSLAESWDMKDRRTYVFHVRRDVKWHDGQPFTARDVKWSYEFLMDPAKALGPGAAVRSVESMALLDDFTLQIRTKTPDVLFLDGLVHHTVAILPQHAYERGESFEKVAVGTGPFKVESHDSQRGQVYVRHDGYWQPPRPYVGKIKIFPPQEEAGRTAAFIGRQNDVTKATDVKVAEPILRQNPRAKSMAFLRDIASDLSLKLDRPPFDDVRVRRAVHMAIDRQAMVKALTFEAGIFNPPGINGVRKSLAIPRAELEALPGWRQPKEQDLAEARRLLAEAGYGSGLSFVMKVDQAHLDNPAQAQVISAQLRSIGVDAKVQPLESGVYRRAESEGDYEMLILPLGRTQPERDWTLHYHSEGTLNKRPVRDAELDRLIDAQFQEFDPEKRRQLFLALQRLLLKEVYSIPLITYASTLLWQSYVNGWVDNQAGNANNQDWSQLWLTLADLPRDRS